MRPLFLRAPPPPPTQILLNLFALSAGAFLFVKWRRLDTVDRRAVWESYGRFTAIICCTSFVGALHDIAFMRASAAFSLGVSMPLQSPSLSQLVDVAQSKSDVAVWLGAALLLDSMQTFFSFVARFLVIVRLMEFSLARTGLQLELSFEGIRRVFFVFVSVVCACGIVSSCVAASHFSKAAYYYQDMAAILRASSDDFETRATAAAVQALPFELSAHKAMNVAFFSTITVHLLMVVCYIVAGTFCYKRFKAPPVRVSL